MSKGDNCPPDASPDFKKEYDKGYEETRRHFGNDIDVPGHLSGDSRNGFLAGKRQARRDSGGSIDTISKCGCLLALSVTAILVISFDWEFDNAFNLGILIFVIGCVLEKIDNVRNKGINKKADISYCGCLVAILIVVVTFFKGISLHEIFPYAIGVELTAMVIDAFS